MASPNAALAADHLRNLPALNDLSPDQAEALLASCEMREVAAGETLWREAEKSSFAAIVLDGRFEEKKLTEFANKQIVVGVYGAGAIIGESSLLDGLPRPLTVSCLASGRLLVLCRDRFHNLQSENPQLALHIYKYSTRSLSIKLAKSFERLAAIF